MLWLSVRCKMLITYKCTRLLFQFRSNTNWNQINKDYLATQLQYSSRSVIDHCVNIVNKKLILRNVDIKKVGLFWISLFYPVTSFDISFYITGSHFIICVIFRRNSYLLKIDNWIHIQFCTVSRITDNNTWINLKLFMQNVWYWFL